MRGGRRRWGYGALEAPAVDQGIRRIGKGTKIECDLVFLLHCTQGAINCVAFSPNGKQLVSGGAHYQYVHIHSC